MKRNFSRILVLVLLIATMTSVLCLPVFADDMPTDGNTAKTYAEKHINESWVKRVVISDKDAQNDSSIDKSKVLTLNGETYYYRNGHDEASLLKEAQNHYKSQQTSTQIGEIKDNLNLQADTQTATDTLAGLTPIINTFLGIVVVLITILLAVFTAFDVCYISFPVFRNKCEEQKQSGEGAFVKTTKNGGTKLRWVSDEAQMVVENYSVESGANPLTKYLGKRVVAYVCVTIILFMFLTGNINVITNIALRIVSFVMNTLQGFSVG